MLFKLNINRLRFLAKNLTLEIGKIFFNLRLIKI